MASNLCIVGVETKGGARYEFPDVLRSDVHKMLAAINGETTTLTLVNVQGACLTMPFRVVDTIAINQEPTWRSPVSQPTSPA